MSVDMRSEDVLAAELNPIGPKGNTISGEPFESELVLYKDDVTETGISGGHSGCLSGSKIGMWEHMHFVAGAGTDHRRVGERHRDPPRRSRPLHPRRMDGRLERDRDRAKDLRHSRTCQEAGG